MTNSDKPWAGLFDHTGEPLDRMPDVVHPSTNGLLIEDGRLLLHRRADSGAWAMPGGRMEIGESAEEGAAREMREETGLECRVMRLLDVHSDPKEFSIVRYPDGLIVQHVVMIFEMERVSGDLAISDESTDLRFFKLDELPEPMAHAARIRLNKLLPRLR